MLKKVVVIFLFNRLMPGVGHAKIFFKCSFCFQGVYTEEGKKQS